MHRRKGDIEAVYNKINYRYKFHGTKDTLIICVYALFVHMQIYHRVPTKVFMLNTCLLVSSIYVNRVQTTKQRQDLSMCQSLTKMRTNRKLQLSLQL